MPYILNPFFPVGNLVLPFNSSIVWAAFESNSFDSLTDGANVTTSWPDISGNGRDMTLHNTTYFTYHKNQIHGESAIQFSDNGNWFILPSMAALTEGHFFAVWNYFDPTSNGGWILGVSANSSHYYAFGTNVYEDFGSNARANFDPGTSTPFKKWHTYHGWSATNDYSLNQDNTNRYVSSSNIVGFPSTPRFGANGFNGNNMMCAAFYLMSRKLTSTEVTTMRNYILAKYGV